MDRIMSPSLPGCLKCRTRLTLATSIDGGATWRRQTVLEDKVGSSLRYHYPTLAQRGCHLYVAYTKFYSKTMRPTDTDFANQARRCRLSPPSG